MKVSSGFIKQKSVGPDFLLLSQANPIVII